ncbi:MAG: hypothetical protein QHH18_04415 [Candidatus Bathyarchaeota archaeon]|jgi:hypothetical protein|nr:hypothetical protein [Candidatus Bathyarchaeota archaeon A05DMB-5]MDH7557831.1 hypothetical protein [Candidatus Bathyarchaeota archaeon]
MVRRVRRNSSSLDKKRRRKSRESRTKEQIEAENKLQEIVIKELTKEAKARKKILVITAEDYMNRSIARMFLERNRLAKKRKVDYVV